MFRGLGRSYSCGRRVGLAPAALDWPAGDSPTEAGSDSRLPGHLLKSIHNKRRDPHEISGIGALGADDPEPAGVRGALMRGCGDVCAARIRLIERAGVAKCLAMARQNHRADPQRDLAIIRKAALVGYKEAARLRGCAASTALRVVKVYSEYAELILAGQPEK